MSRYIWDFESVKNDFIETDTGSTWHEITINSKGEIILNEIAIIKADEIKINNPAVIYTKSSSVSGVKNIFIPLETSQADTTVRFRKCLRLRIVNFDILSSFIKKVFPTIRLSEKNIGGGTLKMKTIKLKVSPISYIRTIKEWYTLSNNEVC